MYQTYGVTKHIIQIVYNETLTYEATVTYSINSHGLCNSYCAYDADPKTYFQDIDVQLCIIRQLCINLVQEHTAWATGVSLNTEILEAHISPLFVQLIPPSAFAAKVLCRTSIMEEVIGTSLSMHLRRHMYARLCGRDAGNAIDSTQALLQELSDTRAELTRVRAAAAEAGFVCLLAYDLFGAICNRFSLEHDLHFLIQELCSRHICCNHI